MLLTILNFDKSVYFWCIGIQKNKRLTTLIKGISHTGDGYMYVAIAFIIFMNNQLMGEEFLIVGLSAFLIEIPAFIILKKIIKRDRPFVHLQGSSCVITPADKFSLPSGHSAAAFLMAVIISNFYPSLSLLAYFWAFCIGTSRVTLGVHYPTDIVAGAILGCVCAFCSLSLAL